MVVAEKRDILVRIDEETFLETVAIADMFVAPYGRSVGKAQIGRMIKSGFDPKKLGIITLSMRPEGRFAILDGNHRRHLCLHLGKTHMLARVFIDLTYEEEAELFAGLNTMKATSALEKFNSRLEFREPRAVDIVRILGEFNLEVMRSAGTPPRGKIGCVHALDELYLERGPTEFTEVINVIHAAWSDEPQAWVGTIVTGFKHFWARYRDDISFKRLVEQLQLRMPNQVLAAAGAYSGGQDSIATKIGKHLVVLYNGKARSKRLPDWPSRAPVQPEGTNTADAYRGARVLRRVEQERGTKKEAKR